MKNKYFFKILLSIIAIILVVVPVSSFAIYQNYSTTLIDSTYVKYDDYLGEIAARTIVLNEWLHQILSSLYSDPYIFNMMISDDLEPANEIRGRLNMRAMLGATPSLHSIYIYNSKIDVFYSTLTVNKTWEEFSDKDLIEELEDLGPGDYSVMVPRKINFSLNNTMIKADVITMIAPKSYTLPLKENDVIIVNFDAAFINNLIRPQLAEQEKFYMIDKEGRIMLSGQNDFLQNVSQTNWMQQILEKNDESGHFLFEQEGESYLACYSYTEQLGGYMVYIAQRDLLFKKTEELRIWTIVLTISVIAIMIAVAVGVTKLLYKPIDILVHVINNTGAKESQIGRTKDEFKLIENKINEMRDMNQSMIEHQQLQRDALAHYFMKDLLTLQYDSEESLDTRFYENNILLNPYNIMPVCIKLDTNSKDSEKLAVLRTALKNMAQDIAKFPILLLDIEDDTIALLFNSDKVLENWFEEFAALFLNSFSLLFKETFTVSLGSECENPADLHKGWQKAMILAEYRFVLGKGRCISQKDVKKYEKANVHYPTKKERYIIDSLNLSRKEDVGKAMGVMLEYISKQSVDNARISMHRLLSMLIREFSRLLAPRHSYEENTANLFDQLNEFLTVQDACQWMTDMCFDIIDEISPETNDIKQDHINKAIEIIENEYDNPNLSSNLIASKLGLSGSYLREIFGQYTNTFLPKYINDFRCQKGKEMLTNTKLPISVISQKIGIVNTKYFYSLFKKNTGMTPSDYRAANKWL